MEVELSTDLDSLGGDEAAVGVNIYEDDPRLAALKPAASPSSFSTAPLSMSTTAIKVEPLAPPSPLANATNPFIERSLTPAEPTIEAPAPPAPDPPPRSSASPPPAPAAASPSPPRRRHNPRGTPAGTPEATPAANPMSPKAGRRANAAKKAAKGEEAAVKDKKCKLAWAVLKFTKGKNPRSDAVTKCSAGRKEDFNYYKHFNASLLYACARYPETFKQWVLREDFLHANPEAAAKGRIPSRATLSRAVKKFKKHGVGGG